MDKVRFAIIGCGWIGGLHAQVIRSLPDAVLEAAVDSSEKAGRRLAEEHSCRYYKDYRRALEDPDIDAVAVCLPTGMHGQVTVEAAKAGKHIICEKPIEIRTDAAQEMIRACREAGVAFSVIMQHRFDDPVLALKKACADGVLGKLLWGASRTLWYRDDAYFANGWRGTWRYDGGGALMNQSIHYIDLLLYLMGEVKSVSGKCRRLLHQQIEAEDVGIAGLEFENGCLGTVEGTTAAFPGEGSFLSVFAENGTVTIRDDTLVSYRLKSGAYPEFDRILGKGPEVDARFGLDLRSHSRQYEDFTAAVREHRAPLVTGEEAIKSLRVIQGIYRSSDEKREIYL